MKDIETIADIRLFVDDFYARVRRDELIGPIFATVIKGDWQPHLNRMYSFWNAALFNVPGFKGNPFAKHAPLQIGQQHFDQWLALFNATINAHFEGPMANDAQNRAKLMADLFVYKLGKMNNPGNIIL
ncbi:group III truncated hemoglobin [Mucilaginibacter sp. X4EP1]|uniref:group III truncated hemoglobin n=1 Tax=Mucilaginibacter sp. X4EP1 TaxID=2723092 RepID=UPI002166DE33|nr:group III truncated hemoglobin [Mucilaginibacter sp. X4EP1]MCS3813268.1 hemoglobin [Mucilaginibacter sp. X4EP1]